MQFIKESNNIQLPGTLNRMYLEENGKGKKKIKKFYKQHIN